MQSNILEYLEMACAKWPDKVAFLDENNQVSFSEVMQKAKKIGTYLTGKLKKNSPVVVISEKGVNTPILYLGVLSGDVFMCPLERICLSFV